MPPTPPFKKEESARNDVSGRGMPFLVKRALDLARNLLFDRQYFWYLATLLFLGEAVLGSLIIWKVPYTKIDWNAYMQQVTMFLDGERDYSRIEGETGPLVYPALHLYIYTAFQRFLPSTSIDDIKSAQYVFLAIYLCTFLLISTIYYLAGRNGGDRRYPQALLIPLTLSKRLHSIFMLRLFNDPIAMLFFYAAVVVLMLKPERKLSWRLGSLLYSLALGVKMNILLFLPGLLVLLFQYRGVNGAVESIAIIAGIQILLPAPFFLSTSNMYLNKSYFVSAFDLSRQFLYEWTVNWRFLSEKTFLSRERAVGLLVGQVSLLALFAIFRWCPFYGGALRVIQEGFKQPSRAPIRIKNLPAYHIPLTLFTSNVIGILFARSLHYQFHSWYFHQIPFLLISGGAWRNLPLGIVLWLMIEYAWATFPSTIISSSLLLLAHIMILGGLWVCSPYNYTGTGGQKKLQ